MKLAHITPIHENNYYNVQEASLLTKFKKKKKKKAQERRRKQTIPIRQGCVKNVTLYYSHKIDAKNKLSND